MYLTTESSADLCSRLLRGFVHVGRAFALALLAAQAVFLAVSVDLVVRKHQPAGDTLPLEATILVAVTGLVLLARWAGGRILFATEVAP